MDFCEFEASLVYSACSKTARATQRNPVWKTKANGPINPDVFMRHGECDTQSLPATIYGPEDRPHNEGLDPFGSRVLHRLSYGRKGE